MKDNTYIKIPDSYKKRNPWIWLGNCFFDYAVIIGSMIIARKIDHIAVYVAALFIIGTRQHALALLGHEGAHKFVSKNSLLNECLWRPLTIWIFGVGSRAYRNFHFRHHNFLGTEKDPEILYKRYAQGLWDLPVTKKRQALNFIRDSLAIRYLMPKTYKGVNTALFPNYKIDVVGIALVMIGLFSGIILTGGWYYLLMWVLPMPTFFIAILNTRVWTEHSGIRGTYRFKVPKWLCFIFFPHNAWCHWEHHKYDSVPFYNLPKIHKLDDSQYVLPSYAALVEIFANSPVIPGGDIGLKVPGTS